jgi:sugar lactone lactonase YvrE
MSNQNSMSIVAQTVHFTRPHLMPAAATAALAALAGGALGCASSPAPAWPTTPAAATEVVRFDASQGSQSEGLAVRGKTAYFGFASTGQVVAVDLGSGKVTPYSSLPRPGAGTGFVTGLALRGDDLYGGLASFAPDAQAGIYKATTASAPATLFAKHAEMAFPNGLAFDGAGQLYVTDSAAGAVFRISPAGEATKWVTSPLLLGGKDGCGAGNGVGVPFDIGANGIVVESDALYVTNTDKGALVRIPIEVGGAPGTPTQIAASCELNGADGLAVAPDGDFIVAINHRNKLVRIDRGGAVATVLAGGSLDFPSSLVFADGMLYVNNFAFLDGRSPGLVQVK